MMSSFRFYSCSGLLLLIVLLVGCDPIFRMRTRVKVSSELQKKITSYPTEVVVYAGKQAGEGQNRVQPVDPGPYRIGILCSAGDDRAFEWVYRRVGCSVRTRILVWAQPLSGSVPPDQSCKQLQENVRSRTGTDRTVPPKTDLQSVSNTYLHASGVVFPSHNEPVCSPADGSIELDLTKPKD